MPLVLASLLFSVGCGLAGSATDAPAGGGRRGAELKRRLGVEFVRIPGGEFTRGGGAEFGELLREAPAHPVRVRDFELSRYEITQAQWELVMGSNPSYYAPCPQCPVEQVSWEMAQEFLARVSVLTGERWRLPTEAEWEYAAGGGRAHQGWAGTDREEELGEYAWFRANSGMKVHPVGQKKPNAYGLFDMSGNVYEWCADWFAPYTGGTETAVNPTGPPSGELRVLRGGSYGVPPWFNRVVYRECSYPIDGNDDNGLRPVREVR